MSEIHNIDNYHLAPLAPKCLCQKDFLLPPDPKFPCRDIREEQLEKTMAYVQALQYWVEKSNPSMLGHPHFLAGSILKLRETMEQYISFFDDTVLDGVASLEGFLEDWTKTTIPGSGQLASMTLPSKRLPWKKQPHWGPLEEPTTPQIPCEEQTKVEASPTQFPRWRKVLHPSQLVTTAGQTPQSPASQEGGPAARVLGKGELDAKGWKSTSKSSRKSKIPHHHLGL